MSTEQHTVTAVYVKLQHVLDRLGEESEDGKGGTGIIGRLARIEDRVNQHDKLAATFRGVAVGVAVMAAALWWAFKAKIEAVLGVTA